MGLFTFIKEAGKKIFGSKEEKKKEQPELTDEQIRNQQADAVLDYLRKYDILLHDFNIRFEEDDVLVLTGRASTQADYEKIALLSGNIAGIAKVDNQITYEGDVVASDTYTVEKGDTLWTIAKSYYGDGSKYQKIVEANQPMITNPDEIYPGQVLRIPQE